MSPGEENVACGGSVPGRDGGTGEIHDREAHVWTSEGIVVMELGAAGCVHSAVERAPGVTERGPLGTVGP